MRTGADAGTRYSKAKGLKQRFRERANKQKNGELPDIAAFIGFVPVSEASDKAAFSGIVINDEFIEVEIERLAQMRRLEYDRAREGGQAAGNNKNWCARRRSHRQAPSARASR